jgi:tetratricopeptide (TPR) repeat protein
MRAVFSIVLTIALGGLVAAGPALAQQGRPPPRTEPQRAQPPAEPQRRLPDPAHQPRLDQLFERLSAAGGEAEAAGIADQISRIWNRSGSDTLDLLMSRVQEAMNGNDGVTALDLLDSILALKPDFMEAYSRRAAVHFQLKDMDGAMRDLRQTLQMEPRHFQALAGVGMVYQTGGEPKLALKAFREALKINPHLKGIKDAAEKLALQHDGQDL